MTGQNNFQILDETPVIDYEGSGYKTDFWEGQGREYEDAAERRALARLLPPQGIRIAEIGAGFGRLADQYAGYEQIILFDYSRTLLTDAAKTWGHDPRFVFVAGNIYDLPLASHILDTLVMVRVMHHLAEVPTALAHLQRTLHQHSVAVLEYANKRNLKALGRWLLRRQEWSPLAQQPVEFVELNFDFHPDWMREQLAGAGFAVGAQYGVSHFRMPGLKSRVSAAKLAQLDEALFALGGKYPVAPSVFVQALLHNGPVRSKISTQPHDVVHLFRCPYSGSEGLEWADENLVFSPESGRYYARQAGVWDFKEPVKG